MNLSSTQPGMEGGTEWVMGALKEAASVPGALTGVGRIKKQGEGILRVEVSLLCGDLNTDWSSTVRQCALQKCTPGLASTGLPPFFSLFPSLSPHLLPFPLPPSVCLGQVGAGSGGDARSTVGSRLPLPPTTGPCALQPLCGCFRLRVYI